MSRVDYEKDRIYFPRESLRRFKVSEKEIAAGQPTPEFIELMKFEVARAREWFERGLPLTKMVNRELALDVELFTRGGQEVLNAIERQEYDVLTSRPAISKPKKLWLVLRAAMGKISVSREVKRHPLQLSTAYGVCRHITRTQAKNFYYAFLVLPKRKRNALCSVYAFMRHADDIADDETVQRLQGGETFSADGWIASRGCR